jgi:cobalamin biosynthesis Mg chelatase CobN
VTLSMRKTILTLTTSIALLACASSAYASGRAVINDCSDDEVLSKTYTQKDYHDALAELPTDADQYGNCRDIIARAQEAAAAKGASKSKAKSSGSGATATGTGSGPGGGTSGGATTAATTPPPSADPLATATPQDRAAIAEAATDGRTAGDDVVRAADVGRAPGTDQVADLPAPIVALLALLAAGAIAFAVVRIRGLARTRRA